MARQLHQTFASGRTQVPVPYILLCYYVELSFGLQNGQKDP